MNYHAVWGHGPRHVAMNHRWHRHGYVLLVHQHRELSLVQHLQLDGSARQSPVRRLDSLRLVREQPPLFAKCRQHKCQHKAQAATTVRVHLLMYREPCRVMQPSNRHCDRTKIVEAELTS